MRNYILFAMGMMLSVSASYAHQVNLTLAPNGSKLLENKYLWVLNATCTIQCHESKNKIMVRVIKNKGTVNGKNLSNGQATSLTVQSNDSISVSAEAGAKVNILNLGHNTVEATCSA